MRNLIYLIIRFSALILFITLECICFYLIVNYNKSQKEIWAYSSNLMTGAINEKVQNIYSFFDLQATNDSLHLENARLLETIINYRISAMENDFEDFESMDTTLNYSLIPARVCSKSVHLRNNYITLCLGANDGIRAGMGVISDEGVIGIVRTVSPKYATVMMVLNSQSRISAKVKSREYSGTLLWTSDDPRMLTLRDIPKHASISIGDTIVTSGYSVSFPPEIPVGTIEDFMVTGGNNDYQIKVRLDYDLNAINYVYVINFADYQEKLQLEESTNE